MPHTPRLSGLVAVLAASVILACGGGADSPPGSSGPDPFAQALGGTWSRCASDGTRDVLHLMEVSGSSVFQNTVGFISNDGSCGLLRAAQGAEVIQSVAPREATLSLGGPVQATLGVGGAEVAARAADLTALGGSPTSFTLLYVTTTSTPHQLYLGVNPPPGDPAHDGSSAARRHAILDASAALQKRPAYRVSGSVSGAALQGVRVTQWSATGYLPRPPASSDAAGGFTFTGLVQGLHWLRPEAPGLVFNPTTRLVTVGDSDVTGVDFVAFVPAGPYALPGYVLGATAPVTLTLSGASTATTTTAWGNFEFPGLANGTYTVTPSAPGHTFSPASATTTIAGANGWVYFTATPGTVPTYSISGAVAGATGTVTLSLSGASTATTTTSSGTYTFPGLASGTYVVTPSAPGCTFSPASHGVTITDANVSGRSFTATCTSPPPTTASLTAVWGTGPTNVWAVGRSGTIVHCDGATCSAVTSGTTSDLRGIWGAAADDVWAVGASSTILHWNGTAWSKVPGLRVGLSLADVWGTSANDVWAVGTHGQILHKTASGWSEILIATTDDLKAAWGTSATDVWFVGNNVVVRWNGATWSIQAIEPWLRDVWGSSTNDVWAVGTSLSDDTLDALRWNGLAWAPSALSATRTFNGIWGSAANDVWAVGQYGAALRWNGSTWSSVSTPTSESLSGIWGSGANDVWAVGGGGTILRWTGSAWSTMGGGG